jgi:hypothetical protein
MHPSLFNLDAHDRQRSLSMNHRLTDATLSRRNALAGLGIGGLAVAARGLAASAHQDTEMANHPMVGSWLGVTPEGPSPAYIMPDGTFFGSSSPISAGPDGTITFLSQQNGTWEPDSEYGIHFTSVQNMHDATGAFIGTGTVDGYPVASEDGESFYDDGTRVRVTLRDASGAVTAVLGEDGSLPPVYGNRLRPGVPVFPTPPAEAATPTSKTHPLLRISMARQPHRAIERTPRRGATRPARTEGRG